jgi:hypothetical protein
MKFFLALALSIAFLFFTSITFAESDKIYGTWVNMDYKWGRPPQKLIYKSDSTFESFVNADSEVPTWQGTNLIEKKWKDSEGNIWFRIKWSGNWGESGYELAKISNSGNTYEYVFSNDEYPKGIDSNHRNYRIYTRE